MAKILTASALAVGTFIASISPGSAMGLSSLADLRATESGQPAIIKIHSRRRSHDMLHDYGFRNVYFLRTRKGYDGNTINVYSARRRYREYHVSVDWYGNIVDRHRSDRCNRRSW